MQYKWKYWVETWVVMSTTAVLKGQYKVSVPLVSPHPYILHNLPSGMEQPATGSWIVWTLSAGRAGLHIFKENRVQSMSKISLPLSHRHTHTHTYRLPHFHYLLTETAELGLNWSPRDHISHELCWLPVSWTSQECPPEYLRLQATLDTRWGLEHWRVKTYSMVIMLYRSRAAKSKWRESVMLEYREIHMKWILNLIDWAY